MQLQDEVKQEVPGKVDGIYRELLMEMLEAIHWDELAEDLIGQ